MLVLKKGAPPFVPVRLGDGAFIRLRAATSWEIEDASAHVSAQLAAVMVGAQDAAALAALLPDFDFGTLAELREAPGEMQSAGVRTRLTRLTERFVLIRLVDLCNDGWTGVADAEGVKFPDKPDEGMIALLLADGEMLRRVQEVVFGRLHVEQAEGKGFAVSLNGAEETASHIAKTAG